MVEVKERVIENWPGFEGWLKLSFLEGGTLFCGNVVTDRLKALLNAGGLLFPRAKLTSCLPYDIPVENEFVGCYPVLNGERLEPN